MMSEDTSSMLVYHYFPRLLVCIWVSISSCLCDLLC